MVPSFIKREQNGFVHLLNGTIFCSCGVREILYSFRYLCCRNSGNNRKWGYVSTDDRAGANYRLLLNNPPGSNMRDSYVHSGRQ